MKVTKIDGLSHKKFEDEGKLVKFKNNKNINEIKEKHRRLLSCKEDMKYQMTNGIK